MDPDKRKRLESRGWRVMDSAAEFLGLTPDEAAELNRRMARRWYAPRLRELRVGSVSVAVVERLSFRESIPPDIEAELSVTTADGRRVASFYTIAFGSAPSRGLWMAARRRARHDALRSARKRLGPEGRPSYRHSRLYGEDVYDSIAICAPLRHEAARTAEDLIAGVLEYRRKQGRALDPAFVAECVGEMIALGTLDCVDGRVWLAMHEGPLPAWIEEGGDEPPSEA